MRLLPHLFCRKELIDVIDGVKVLAVKWVRCRADLPREGERATGREGGSGGGKKGSGRGERGRGKENGNGREKKLKREKKRGQEEHDGGTERSES